MDQQELQELTRINMIYVFQFMKQNIMYTLFDDFHKWNLKHIEMNIEQI